MRLDPYLRIQIQRRGVTIIKNTYAGFDTEFELIDERKRLNKLISIQTATKGRTIIKVPLYNIYDISYVNPLSAEVTSFYKPKFQEDKVFEKNILNESLKHCVASIRLLKYKSLDRINRELIEELSNLEGITSYTDDSKDQIVFALPLTNLITNIIYTNHFSLKELVTLLSSESSESNTKTFHKVLDCFFALKDQIDVKKI